MIKIEIEFLTNFKITAKAKCTSVHNMENPGDNVKAAELTIFYSKPGLIHVKKSKWYF